MENFAIATTRWVGSLHSIVFHTIVFAGSFAAVLFEIIHFDRMLLILTTVVSLEAIYLAIFIQMSLNYTNQELEEVEHDIDEIQEDIDELQEDVEEMTEEEKAQTAADKKDHETLDQIREGLTKLMKDVERLQQGR